MNDWTKIAFVGLLAWLAWRLRGQGAGPSAVYSFGDVISAPLIVAENGNGPMQPDPAPTPLASSAQSDLQAKIEAAARRGGLVSHGSGSVGTARGGTAGHQEP
jgi:hypothetical protein